jgi:hypothetical protein
MIPGKFYGYRMESEGMQPDNIINCIFENCQFVYDQLYSTIRTNAYFKDCFFYNCLRVNTGESFIADNCRFVRTKNSGVEGAFIEMKTWKTFVDNNPSKKYLTPSITYNVKLILKNCSFDAGNSFAHLISSHLTDNKPMAVNVDLLIEDCELLNFISSGDLMAGNEIIHFNSYIIKGSMAPSIKFRVQSNWTGKMSLVNSVVDAYYGDSYFQTSKDLIVRDANICDGKLSLTGVYVHPSYNYIPILLFKDMPKEGTLYWQDGKPSWSNGTYWVDATGKPL